MVPTLTQYLLQNLTDHPDQKDLALIMSDLATIGKLISRETNRAGLSSILGSADTTNIQGETVQKLDVFANETCKNYLRATGHFAALASEEEEDVVDMRGHGSVAKYVIAFDPLDGSSNIDVNVSIGTIFSVHQRRADLSSTDPAQFFQPGTAQVLAGYILYGASTVIVFSLGDGVHEFTLDQSLGEFLLSNERMEIPAARDMYSVNEANCPYMTHRDRRFVEHLRNSKRGTSRYIGSLVADFHRTLKKGGIFLYPAIDKDGSGKFTGKLRLNYEVKPMAFIMEAAGGRAVNGTADVMSLVPSSLHERTGLVFGNREAVEEYLSFV